MTSDGYEIVRYHPELLPQVLEVLRPLWGDHTEMNSDYFKWKYHDNPYADSPLGVVSIYHGKVVGFRGYFGTRFEIPGKDNSILLLIPGDTCVHPDHRRKGLSVRMGNLAMKELAPAYRMLLNMTSNRSSLPGYLKLGFLPLSKKTFLSQYRLTGFLSYIWHYRKRPPCNEVKIRLGTFGEMRVSDRPRPREMASVIGQQFPPEPRIRLFQDEAFFRWRYNNNRGMYIFYFLGEEENPTAYIVVGLSPNLRRGYILDFSESEEGSVESLLALIIQMDHFDILSIYRFCLNVPLLKTVLKLGFRENSIVRKIEKRLTGELPLLIRPVDTAQTEDKFYIHGLDIRKIDNWQIKGICSDDT